MKNLQRKTTLQESLLRKYVIIFIVSVTFFSISFVLYSDYKIYGSFFTERMNDSLANQYYSTLMLLIALIIIFEIVAIIFTTNRSRLIRQNAMSSAINKLTKAALNEPTTERKIKTTIETIKETLPLTNAGLIGLEKDGPRTIYIENSNEKELLEKAILTNNREFLIEKFVINGVKYNLIAKPERDLDDEEKKFYKEAFEHLKKIIENAILSDKSEEEALKNKLSAERYKTLHRLANELRSTLTYDQTYWKIVDLAIKLFKAQSSSIIDVSGPQKDWHFVALKNIDNETVSIVEKRLKEKSYGENLFSIKATKSLNYIANTRDAPGWIETKNSPNSWVGIPIVVNDEVIAVLSVDGKKPNQFSDEDLLFANAFSKTINDVLQKNIMLEEYSNLSITDALTGLYNRREFDKRIKDEVERAKRYKRPLTIISMDLDRFKELNDTFGHLAGDNVLKIFGEILKKSIRNMDIAFRVGGDEFTIILPETEEEYAFSVAERIRYLLKAAKMKIDFAMDVSIGVASYRHESIINFLNRADKALYKAKSEKDKKVQVAYY